jgi:hypothetical protein
MMHADSTDAPGCLFMFLGYLPGMILATIISWEANHSLLWASLHCYASWAYVIYHNMP